MSMQTSYDPLNFADHLKMDLAQATRYAKLLRDKDLRNLRRRGVNARGWRLTGQLRPYAGFGQPDGRVRTVYYITHNGGERP